MIPDRLPSGASAGEKKVFDLLQKLPDDVIVYYEPVVANRYPDFVVILPDTGLLVIEAKGWYLKHIISANNHEVVIASSGGRKEAQRHPMRQAREYQFKLMDRTRDHPAASNLVHDTGQLKGKFRFPFGHAAVLNNCTRKQLRESNLSEIFLSPRVIARDELDALQEFEGDELKERIRELFDPYWIIEPLSDDQVSVLRAVLHPEVIVSSLDATEASNTKQLQILDLRQERNARSIGRGHRIIYGVAGSGKTIILIARARLLSQDRSKRNLILCYTTELAQELRRIFKDTPTVECWHFHKWGGQHGVQFDDQEEAEAYGERLLAKLEQSSRKYDAVLVDEAQDFAKSWLACSKEALKEPEDGDLLIVGDGSQKLYRRRPFSWNDAGISARGRTINKRFDLDKNYRNTQEILRLASQFVRISKVEDPSDTLPELVPNIHATNRHGPMPTLANFKSLSDEINGIQSIINSLMEGGFEHRQIAVLYRANSKAWVNRLALQLSESHPLFWRQGRQQNFQNLSGIRITTMHSAKGLQWPVVIVPRVDMMPLSSATSSGLNETKDLERNLMYVAMTRAEKQLFLTASSTSGFADEISRLLWTQNPLA